MNISTKTIASRTLQGIAVSPDIHIAKIHVYDPVRPVVSRKNITPEEIDIERAHLRDAIENARQVILGLRKKVQQTLDEEGETDKQLSELAEEIVNQEALSDSEGEEEEETATTSSRRR
jgi:phosphoenolpyruvate-protein kinase (PTS system EI component)